MSEIIVRSFKKVNNGESCGEPSCGLPGYCHRCGRQDFRGSCEIEVDIAAASSRDADLPPVEINTGAGGMIEDYVIEFANCLASMREKVLALRDQGWTVCGGVAMACCSNGRMSYAQAMIKPAAPMVLKQDKGAK